MSIKEKEIELVVERVVNRMGYTLVDVELKGDWVRVFIDKPRGITLKDCVKLSKVLMERLEDEFGRRYRLEVSSPGVGRRLKKAREIDWALGSEVIIQTKNGEVKEGVLDYHDENEGVVGVSGEFFKLSDVVLLKLRG